MSEIAQVSPRAELLENRRLSKALEGLTDAIADDALEVPGPVTEVEPRRGVVPLLPVEAIELARRTYFEQHGTMADAARAVVASDLVEDTSDFNVIYDRLKNWWKREGWPRRTTRNNFKIRDANHEGGLFRGTKLCSGVATGNGPAVAGEPCGETALPDSDFCPWHDPRPKYLAKRQEAARKLQAGRKATMVPIGPLRKTLEQHRRKLLSDARKTGREVHVNSNGIGLLSDLISVDPSRIIKFLGGSRGSDRATLTVVTVKTALKCLEPLGESFEDVYGFPPPLGGENLVCPECGGKKTAAAKACRDCFDQSTYTVRCRHTTSGGHRCPTTTEHPCGYCSKCRKQVLHVRVKGKQAKYAHPTVVMFALQAHLAGFSPISIARKLWLTNASRVRDTYRSREVLRGEVVKVIARHRWQVSRYAAEQSFRQLLANHGPVEWPAPVDSDLVDGELPSGPFIGWLRVQVNNSGSYKATGDLTGLNPDYISRLLRGSGPSWIRVKTIRDAMESARADLPLSHLFELEDVR